MFFLCRGYSDKLENYRNSRGWVEKKSASRVGGGYKYFFETAHYREFTENSSIFNLA